jgi:predicted KAP-like P-loop ATPase
LVRDNPSAFAGGSESRRLLPEEEERRTRVYAAVADAAPGEDRRRVVAILRELFPKFASASRPGAVTWDESWHPDWRRKQRVCAPEVFPIYFQLAVPEAAVSRSLIAGLLRLASSPSALGQELLRVAGEDPPASRLFIRDVLWRLEDHTPEDVPAEDLPTFAEGLLAVADELVRDDPPPAPLQFGVDVNIGRLVYQLLLRVGGEEERYQLLLGLVCGASSLSTVVREVALVEQHWEEADAGGVKGEPTVNRERIPALREAALRRIHEAEADGSLLAAPRLRSLLWTWRRWEGDGPAAEWFNRVAAADDGLKVLLMATLSPGGVQVMGSYDYTRTWHADRKLVDGLADDPQEIESRVRGILAALPPETGEPLAVALRAYLDYREE